MTTIDIIIPSFRSPELTYLTVASFEKFKKPYNFRYIVVENSDDETYLPALKQDFSNIVWVQNPTSQRGSLANAEALTVGMEKVENEYVFMCHNDVVACHESWMQYFMSKIEEGKSLVGISKDPHKDRIGAVHQSGLLVKTEIAKAVSLYPEYSKSGQMLLDVGDNMTKYCRDNGLDYFICNNTFNDPENVELLKEEKYRNFHVDRILDDDNRVIFLHLGRGIQKYNNQYFKPNRILLPQWVEFTTNLLDTKK
tara:strand:- start:7874 stop:8632 length:759 start_codon:yes stop_codon:yes gene_type:complete